MDALKLRQQICFPLYACSKEIIRRYTPLLEPLGLTYTQYIAMMVFWEHKSLSVSELGKRLYLDSGTLTPMLKKMEKNGWIRRERSEKDERKVVATITPEGELLKEKANEIPLKMMSCTDMDNTDAMQLYSLLYKFLDSMK